MRKAMGEQASRSRAVGYFSAGTVELIVSGADKRPVVLLPRNEHPPSGRHPVTEAITGIDLVEQMIRVAAGERSASQDDVKIEGWSIENRVYAEDPYRGFLPSTGRLVHYQPPVAGWTDDGAAHGRRGIDGVRVDDGVYEGGEVSMFYDPMIAKLITWGETRDEAADKQVAALDAFQLDGLGHNIDFLSAIMQHPRFRSGELTTGFIAEEYPEGFHGARLRPNSSARWPGSPRSWRADRARRIDGQLGRRLRPPAHWAVTFDKTTFDVALTADEVTVDGTALDLRSNTPATAWSRPRSMAWCWRQGRTHAQRLRADHARGDPQGAGPACPRGALCQAHDREDPARSLALPDLPDAGPAGGAPCRRGRRGRAGQPLAVVEAMKMENILRARRRAG
jgi:propionyl-CoA carboxylase alpha chain